MAPMTTKNSELKVRSWETLPWSFLRKMRVYAPASKRMTKAF